MLDHLRSTRFKLRVAHLLYRALRLLGVARRQVVNRGGVRFALDLSEGIDLSLFLFGRFQPHVGANRLVRLPEDAVVVDVGANCGAIALALAQRCPRGRVYAFEPTAHAFARLQQNLALNPALAARIEPLQSFVAGPATPAGSLTAFASWRVDTLQGERHPVHLGIAHAATREQTTLDDFVAREGLARLDLVKIDTDGNELAVLEGMRRCLETLRPAVIFELSTYLLRERGESFDRYQSLFDAAGYRLCRASDGRAVHAAVLERLVPPAGSIDVLALPGDGRRA